MNNLIKETRVGWQIGDKLVCINNIGLKPLVFGTIYVVNKVVKIKDHVMVELVGCPAGNLYQLFNFHSLAYLKYINSGKALKKVN